MPGVENDVLMAGKVTEGWHFPWGKDEQFGISAVSPANAEKKQYNFVLLYTKTVAFENRLLYNLSVWFIFRTDRLFWGSVPAHNPD